MMVYLQKMRNAVLDHLNNYAESVCIDCGFVQRDCKCLDVERRHCSSQLVFLSSAMSVKDSGMQTEPMIVVGMPQKVNAPGISVFVPQNYHLSPDVRIPLTVAQPNTMTVPSTALNGSSMNVNTLTPNVITLPPTLTFPAGCPPSFINPMSLSTSASTQSYVSVLHPPLLGVTNIPNSVSAESDTSPSRKRKRDDTDVIIADASVQTTGKSYVKKMKIRLGSFSASDFKIVGKDLHSVRNKSEASAGGAGVAADSGTVTGSQVQAELGDSGTNTKSSPGGHKGDVKKDAETPVEKKYTTVWKLLEDSSDDESTPDKCSSTSPEDAPVSTPDKRSSTSPEDVPVSTPDKCSSTSPEDAPVSTATKENSATSQAPDDKDGSGADLADKTCQQQIDGRSGENTGSAAVPQSLPECKEDTVSDVNDHPMKEEEEEEDKLVIDTQDHSDICDNKSTASRQSNDWEFRNGTQESESPDEEKEASKSPADEEQLEAASKANTEDVGSKANQVDKCDSAAEVSDSKLPESIPSKSAPDEGGLADSNTEVLPDSAEKAKLESEAKPRRVYGKFEYTPTGEHILRCLVPKCSQTFDRKLAADVHNHVHPEFVPGTDANEGPTYLQCHRCEFQAPFYHWYDLLRHMREKHDIRLIDSTAEHTCEYCGLGFETKDLLVSHIDFHYSNRYKCIHCGLLLLTWGQV